MITRITFAATVALMAASTAMAGSLPTSNSNNYVERTGIATASGVYTQGLHVRIGNVSHKIVPGQLGLTTAMVHDYSAAVVWASATYGAVDALGQNGGYQVHFVERKNPQTGKIDKIERETPDTRHGGNW